jgi:hypothetical protein
MSRAKSRRSPRRAVAAAGVLRPKIADETERAAGRWFQFPFHHLARYQRSGEDQIHRSYGRGFSPPTFTLSFWCV